MIIMYYYKQDWYSNVSVMWCTFRGDKETLPNVEKTKQTTKHPAQRSNIICFALRSPTTSTR